MSTDTKVIGGIVIATIIVFVGGIYLSSRQDSQEATVSEDQVVSRQGLHWHPELSIYIKGEKQEIPANIGIGAVHKPIHTHDTSGVLHLEMQGLVKKEDIKLGQFFKIWGKQFNSNCIFDACNGDVGTVKMTVNGQESFEFGNYMMKDVDKIEIKYE